MYLHVEIFDGYLLEYHWDENMVFKDGVDYGFLLGPLLVSYVGFEDGIK